MYFNINFCMGLYLVEVSTVQIIVSFPFILTGIDFFLLSLSRIPVRCIDKCAIAAIIAPSIRKTDKITLKGAPVEYSHMVYKIIPTPIAIIKNPESTEILILSVFVT